MKRISNPKAVAALVVVGGLMVAFQNCSKVEFAQSDAALLKGTSGGATNDVTLLPEPATNVDQVSNDQQPQQQQQTEPNDQTPVAQMTPPPTPPASNDDMTTTTDDTTTTTTTTTNDTTMPTPTPTPPTMSDEAKQYYAECEAKGKKSSLPLTAGASVENLSGSKAFSATSLHDIANLSGNQAFLQSGDSVGTIDSIKSVTGTTLICGFNVTSINDISGNVTIVGGNIGSIDSKSGTVKLIGGTVGTISNSNGNFKYEEIH